MFQVTQNVCSDVLAPYICAKTCDMCGEYLRQKPLSSSWFDWEYCFFFLTSASCSNVL